MKKSKIIKSRAESYFIKGKGIPKGCQLCLIGAKAVLFINGLCQKPEHCYWYCPISSERKDKNISYANEIRIESKKELLEEINKTNAKGMSITGGDPLFAPNVKQTLDYIKYVKKVKGKKFHVHLYTNGLNFNEKIALELASVGLDEIRFNPPKEKWEIIKFALNKGIIVGAEVPFIPEEKYIQELEEFTLYLDKIGAKFININEFEYCFPNSQYLKDRGFKLEKGSIASVENSRKLALKWLSRISPKVSLKIHFCPIITKDYWQLKERYSRRAMSIKLPYEEISEEGLLLYAQIEGSEEKLKKLTDILQNKINLRKNYVHYQKTLIKLPIKFAIENNFMELLSELQLKGFIIETTPFRESKYCQITEKTPIKVFKKEMGLNADNEG